MTEPWKDRAAIDRMLDESETWAIVGLGDHPWRTAYSVAQELQARGKRIVPVHPSADGSLTVLGELAYPTLEDIPFPIDVVDVFRRSEMAGEFADQAVKVGARGVWFQRGVVDEAAFRRTTEAGVPMVMDVCPSQQWFYREHARRG